VEEGAHSCFSSTNVDETAARSYGDSHPNRVVKLTTKGWVECPVNFGSAEFLLLSLGSP